MRILGWSVLTLTALLAAALTYLHVADLRTEAQWAARTLLGRTLTIEGALNVDVLPAIGIEVEGLTLANAPWGSQPHMLSVARASARIDPWSLVQGPVRIEDVAATEVTVLVESNESGLGNWSLSGPDSDPEPPDPGAWLRTLSAWQPPVVVEQAALAALTVTVRGEPDQTYRVEELQMSRDGDGAQQLSLTGDLRGLPLSLTGRIGRLAGRGDGQGLAVDLNGALDTLEIQVQGALGRGETVDVALSSEDLADLLSHFDLSTPLQGPLDVTATLGMQDEGWRIDADSRAGAVRARWRADLADGGLTAQATVQDLRQAGAAFGLDGLPDTDLSLGARLQTRGTALMVHDGEASIRDARASFEATIDEGIIDTQVQVEGPRLADLGFELPDIPFRAAVAGRLAPESVNVPTLDVRFGPSDLSGNLALRSGARPGVSGHLESRLLDLTPFLPAPDEAPDPEPAGAAAADSDGDGRGDPGEDVLFSREPLPLERLRSADVALVFTAARFVQGNLELEDVHMDARLEDGRLSGELTLQAPHGGSLEGRVNLDASQQPAHLAVVADTRDMRVNLMSGDQPAEQVPPLGIAVDIDASGDSAHALAASASGQMRFTLDRGRISNTSLPWLSGDLLTELLSTLNPFREQDDYTELECLVTLLELEDGDGELPVMLYQGQKIKVVGNGTVDLEKERLNVEFNTQPREGIGVSADMFVTPFVTVSGPLTSPGIGLNKKGVLLQGGAAFLTGGLSAVVTAAFDRARGSQDDCERARAAARLDSGETD